MEKYSFILIPEEKSKSVIENFRIQNVGQKLVDGLPPHISLKRRFESKFSEKELINILDNFQIKKIIINFDKAEMFADKLVLTSEDNECKIKHKEMLNILGKEIVTIGPQWEGDNFGVHMTLLSNVDSSQLNNVSSFLGNIGFDKICLIKYEMERDSVNNYIPQEICCKDLII